jgi:hypothetical protein
MSVRADKAPILVQAADVLRRARKLPAGPARNDLRQLAQGLLELHRADALAPLSEERSAPWNRVSV